MPSLIPSEDLWLRLAPHGRFATNLLNHGVPMIDTLWGSILGRNVKKEQLIFDALRAVPLFNELSNRELRTVQKLVYVRHYTDRETVFNAGDPSLGMYIIKVGAVRIIREIPGGQ